MSSYREEETVPRFKDRTELTREPPEAEHRFFNETIWAISTRLTMNKFLVPSNPAKTFLSYSKSLFKIDKF